MTLVRSVLFLESATMDGRFWNPVKTHGTTRNSVQMQRSWTIAENPPWWMIAKANPHG
ncbi:MAG TPA: hypothetical protein VHE32_05485 [Rhodanobacteraceae bacterium]|nr:hypothetical protein [Rhodanobacteraceae bacterium]